jgi:hypothetical protein
MPTAISIYQTCGACNGTGIDRHTTGKDLQGNLIWFEGACELCNGTGLSNQGELRYKEGVFPTYQILEVTDPAEYVSLAPGNVALYNLIISAGTVDLSETTTALAVLRGMFAVGTTTRTNLEALIS